MRGYVPIFTFLLLLTAAPTAAYTFSLPPNDGYVTDAAGILTEKERTSIAASLQAYADSTSNEIAVVTLKSLQGSTIEDVGLSIGRAWQVGSTKSNGILILVSYEDRIARIEVGYGLEGAVPDIVAKGVIDTELVPLFRDGQYALALQAVITSLQKHIGGEYTQDRYIRNENGESPWSFVAFFAFIAFQWLLSILGRTKSWWLGGVFGALAGILLTVLYTWWLTIPFLIVVGLFLDFIVSRNYSKRGHTSWWAGGGWGPGSGGFGGGSGGGFGGFGGGSFGGGGASGRW